MNSQKWYDDNRTRFEAETTDVETAINTHKHEYKRLSPQVIGCDKCTAEWRDLGMWTVVNGKLLTT